MSCLVFNVLNMKSCALVHFGTFSQVELKVIFRLQDFGVDAVLGDFKPSSLITVIVFLSAKIEIHIHFLSEFTNNS